MEFSAPARRLYEHEEHGLMQACGCPRKLGLSAAAGGEFHLLWNLPDGCRSTRLFGRSGAAAADPVESVHFGVNSLSRMCIFCVVSGFSRSVRHRARKFLDISVG